MMNIARLLALASFSLVTACSGGIETAGGQSQAIKEALQAGNFGKRKKQAPPTPVLTRALLDQITVPSLEVTIENTGSTAYMIPLASRVNSGPGRVTVWKTGVSDENIILRNGVLVGTKGVSNDLGSADASATVRALNSRQSGGGARTH